MRNENIQFEGDSKILIGSNNIVWVTIAMLWLKCLEIHSIWNDSNWIGQVLY